VKAVAASFALAALLATPVLAKPKQGVGRAYTNPSDIVAAEIAFNRLAREKGQWTAFLETAADDAVMFVPQKVLAKDWLKDRANPPKAVQWQPQRVYISCNGRTAASTGAWQRPDGTQGYFTTIWRLGDKGEWKWALDHGDALKTPLPQKEFTEGHVATCNHAEKHRSADGAPRADESLLWDYAVHDDGSREVRVRVWNGEDYDLVIDDKVAANP
tara:strand:+ start:185 stop:829 length:645 start_codon:yes stop_codon:yes gene_type:complete